MSLLTRVERQTLTRDERITLRRQRARDKWPDTDGRPPWLVRTWTALLGLAQCTAMILANAAASAVLDAAKATLDGGQARHEFAVDTLIESVGTYAIDVAREDAAGLVKDAYELLAGEGQLE